MSALTVSPGTVTDFAPDKADYVIAVEDSVSQVTINAVRTDSGAWRWTAQQRERYANHLEDPEHLIAVTASANRSKGARGPENWKTDDRTYWCRYAIDWVTIKDTWERTATAAEFTTLAEMLTDCDVPHQLGVAVITRDRHSLTPKLGDAPQPDCWTRRWCRFSSTPSWRW